MANVKIKAAGMHCTGCEGNAQDFVSEVNGVKKVKADYKKGTIEVQYDEKTVTIEEIKEAIARAGYEVE
jgi:copper chaperone CopZ